MAIGGGRLGAMEPGASTWKTLYKPATGVLATVNITVCNRAAAVRTVKIAQVQHASDDTTPADGEMKIPGRRLMPAGDPDGLDVLQFTGVMLLGTNNDKVNIWADGVDVDFTADGVTETV